MSDRTFNIPPPPGNRFEAVAVSIWAYIGQGDKHKEDKKAEKKRREALTGKKDIFFGILVPVKRWSAEVMVSPFNSGGYILGIHKGEWVVFRLLVAEYWETVDEWTWASLWWLHKLAFTRVAALYHNNKYIIPQIQHFDSINLDFEYHKSNDFALSLIISKQA
jgi:hypothetical protein